MSAYQQRVPGSDMKKFVVRSKDQCFVSIGGGDAFGRHKPFEGRRLGTTSILLLRVLRMQALLQYWGRWRRHPECRNLVGGVILEFP
jgi:hypothetical protein